MNLEKFNCSETSRPYPSTDILFPMSWSKVAQILQEGGVAIIPSESSYGIAALASNPKAIEKLYKIKQREVKKPSLLIVGSIKQAESLVKFNALAKSLINKFWPGSLTLVLEARDKTLSPLIYGDSDSLAVRFPNKKKLATLALKIGTFILPSANLTGQKPPFTKDEIDQSLIKKVDFLLDEPTDGNKVSTLVDARGNYPVILRAGAVSVEGVN